MVGNIVGEPFKKYVDNQIRLRQKVYGNGFNSPRKQEYINYLNSRLSWVKMASSVLVNPPLNEENINNPQAINTSTFGQEGIDRLRNLGLENPEAFLGYKLASSAILFNGLEQANFDAKFNENEDGESSIDPTIADKFFKWTRRFGYSKSNSIWNRSAYGLGGTDFGLQPMPGITGVEVEHINRGSIKKATITLKAYNKFQFELIDILYLRLGFTMLVEWGNSHYIESDGKNKSNENVEIGDIATVGTTLTEQFWFQSTGATPLEMSEKIEEYRIKYDSNYDAMFGRVSNFNWNYNPDGSYDITIQLTSLGDVVESFKVNTFQKPSKEDNGDDEANKDQISLHLYQKRKEFREGITDSNKDYLNFYNNTSIFEDIKKFFGGDPDDEYSYYIRFQTLLEFIKNDILVKFTNQGDKKFPIVDINTNKDLNVMSIFPNQISIDPRICIIKSTYFNPPIDEDKVPFYTLMELFSSTKDGVNHGKLMNIYLNFAFIKNILKNNLDNKGNLSLYNFLKAICDGINRSLGSVNNLEPIVNDETNVLSIIDQTQFEGRDKLRKSLGIEELRKGENSNIPEEEEESTPINIYGYNLNDFPSTSNFVKGFNFNTEISPNLANLISIGAAASGTVVGEDATAFSQWNKGLTDKFFSSISDPLSSDSVEEQRKKQIEEKERAKQREEELKKQRQITSRGSGNYNAYNYDISSQEAKIDRNLIREYRDYYLPYTLGAGFNTGKYLFNENSKGRYLEFNEEVISRGFTSFKNYFSPYTINKNKPTTGTIGFIPVNLSIELDGIAGIRIYQKLRIDTKFLPSNYPDVLEFLVKQVNHSIQGNKWITRLETISVPKVQEIPFIDETTVETLETIEAPNNLIFSSPTGNSNILSQIRNDKEGRGSFGAPRKERLHSGIDLLTERITTIVSPIEGKAFISKAFSNSKTSGIRIEGTGEYTGYTVKIFYIDPSSFIKSGQTIKRGAKIGIPQDLSLDYSDRVLDHIHYSVQVKKGDKIYNIDPSTLKYS